MRLHTLFLVFFFALSVPVFTFAEDPPPDFKNIVLPPNPTRSDVSKYLKNLEKEEFEYAENTSTFVSENFIGLRKNITLRLNEIPSDYIDMILEDIPTFPRYKLVRAAYTNSVIARTDLTPKHAEIIANHLQKHSELINVINRYRWESLVEKQILKAAKNNDADELIPEYAEALARLNTEGAIKVLPELLTGGNAITMTNTYYAVHRIIPDGVDWQKIANKAWENAKQDPDFTHIYAPIAAAYGHTEALIVIAKKLNSHSVGSQDVFSNNRMAMQHALLQLVDAQLWTADELIQYVLKNRDKLVFDRESGVYTTK